MDGRTKKNRTGIDTTGIFGAQAKFIVDLDAFPILTTKKVWFKGIVIELLWFLAGDTNIKYLVDNDVHIWDEWAYKRHCEMCKNTNRGLPTQEEFINHIKTHPKGDFSELGEGTYGGMWRKYPYYYDKPEYEYGSPTGCVEGALGMVDQIQKVMDKLKSNPDDRRMIVSAWHPYWVDHCALPPCHCLFHFNTEELTLDERYAIFEKGWDAEKSKKEWKQDGVEEHKALDEHCIPRRRLNCLLYQRSCDTFLGVPFNITSYCLLLAMVAHVSNMECGTFTHTYGDLHIYVNHLEQVELQLSRTPKILPKLWLNPKVKSIFDFTYDDIKLIGYDPHPAIKGEVAI
jgi:thymidylate synthase